MRLPAAVSDLTARRLGDEVVLQFTIPSANTDNTRPADLDRVEVFAHTGPLPSPADYIRYGTLVGNLAVRPSAGGAQPEAPPGADQGARARILEAITAAHLEIGPMPPIRTPLTTTLAARPAPPVLMRYYVAVGANRRNRRGGFSAPLGVPLVTPPAAPAELRSTYTQDDTSLEWPAPALGEAGDAPLAYNVYADEDTAPVNATPLAQTAFTDPRMEFGTRRCYLVRTVRMYGAVAIESAASPPACLTPIDTFPPAAPRELKSVTSENAVSLIWEPSAERDLAGYLVLRAEAPGEKLAPLTPAPVKETTFRDTGVKPGVSYVYAVVAVDTATPPNASEFSNQVTEVIR